MKEQAITIPPAYKKDMEKAVKILTKADCKEVLVFKNTKIGTSMISKSQGKDGGFP